MRGGDLRIKVEDSEAIKISEVSLAALKSRRNQPWSQGADGILPAALSAGLG